jgi:hypothetical protein
MTALAHGKQVRNLADGHDDSAGQLGNSIIYAGGIVMLDASGRAKAGATETGSIGVGVALTNRDLDRYDATSTGPLGQLADNVQIVRWSEGIFCFANSGANPFLSSDQPGLLAFIEDDQTISKLSTGKSPAGFFHHLDGDGVWVEMGKVKGALALDMITVTDASAAHLAGAETFTGVKNFASGADPVFAKEANHTVAVTTSTTAATAGGNLTVASGAGSTSGAGGVAKLVGGAGGTTGAGGEADLKGGAGGATSGTGGAVVIAGGAGTNGNANGGAVSIDGGAKNGSGVDGEIGIGLTHGADAKFGVKVRAAASAWGIADPGNAGAIAVTDDGVCNLTSAGAETRTLAIPTYIGQRIALHVDTFVGNIAITVASAINVAGNTVITFTAVSQNIHLVGCTLAGVRVWRVVAKDGGTLS